MTDMFISIDAEATLGTKCPTHKLEIKKMTEIEKTEGEIKVLQAKLELLKEMEKHKSPVEKAFKKVYGEYPPTTPSVSNSEDERWSNFQKGYNASKEECKVEEKSKPTPKTLYNALDKLDRPMFIDDVCEVVEGWLPKENIVVEQRDLGWNDAIRTIKQKIR